LEAEVAPGAQTAALGQVSHAHAWVACGGLVEKRGDVIGRAIVDRDQLDLVRSLPEHGLETLHDESLLAVRDEDDAQARDHCSPNTRSTTRAVAAPSSCAQNRCANAA